MPAQPPLIDLASRHLGGSVMAASDESFGEKEHLLVPSDADFTPGTYGHRGEVVDGWETRRRRTSGHDWALIRLGAPGEIRSVEVDTSFFTGNHPPQCRLEALGAEGYPSPEELSAPDAGWEEIVPCSALRGDARNSFPVATRTRFTHVRLSIFPDGGVARLRVNGRAVPDPRRLAGLTFDLAAREHGGLIEAGSDAFYSSAWPLNLPAPARNMGDGWETRRRRTPGNDWVVVRLAAPGRLQQVEVDTSHYKYNASGEFALHGAQAEATPEHDSPQWFPLLPRTRLQPDTRHFFDAAADAAGRRTVTHVRLDAFPDGGMSRLRLYGSLAPGAERTLAVGWFNSLPAAQALAALTGAYRIDPGRAAALVARRPLAGDDPDADTLLGRRPPAR
jgi:allantoicase